jgi:SAM-dependent methyltransferase
VSCRNCATLYTPYHPWYSSQEFYSGYYPEILSEPEFIKKRLSVIVSSFTQYRKTNRLLDLGCGSGALLQAAIGEGWQAEGLDISPKVVEYASNLGLKVKCSELEEAGYPAGQFDVVVASELLEHLTHPRRLITEVARVLRPGGLFWTTTPHARGASARALGLGWSMLCPPEHLQLFSISGIKKLLSAGGFGRILVATEGANPVEIWNALRTQKTAKGEATSGPERVQSSYQLNEALLKSNSRRVLKWTVNGVLRLSHLGDSLKIFAYH